jgi:iron(II)-dependent oxidoreductase
VNVRLRPALSWQDVPGWLADAAGIAVPSTREVFGPVALEALSVGTPIVAYAVGYLPDLIGDAGALVPTKSGPVGLCAATRGLLSDPVRYEHAGAAARRRARDFRPEIIAHRWLEAALT